MWHHSPWQHSATDWPYCPFWSFRETMPMSSTLAKLLLTHDKSSEEADESMCASKLSFRANRKPLILDYGVGGFADSPLSEEISDFKPCSRIQNIHDTDRKCQQRKLIPTDCSSCLWSYNLFFHIMHQPNQNTVVSVLSALHWLKKKNSNFSTNLSLFFFPKEWNMFYPNHCIHRGKRERKAKRGLKGRKENRVLLD